MFLYGQAAAGGSQVNPLMQFIPLILIFVVFYVLFILPARKKQKQHQARIEQLKGGERILTTGGIFGTVKRVMPDRIELEIDRNCTIQITKSAVAGIIDETGAVPTEVK